ncbi:MAG: rane protein [Frankiales bacterium]|nr:rane protein [Frankiales bacterium]
MPPSRLPRHAAAETSRSRAVLPPAVLLTSAALAFGGLAVLPADGAATTVKVTAAAATSSTLVQDPRVAAPSQKDFDALYGIPQAQPAKVAAARVAPRASRAKRTPPKVVAPLWVRPGVGHFTSGYKWRWGRMHTGIDLAGPYGSPIRAVGAGTVIEAGMESGYGYIVKVELLDGTVTYYAHNSRLLVSAGEQVTAGQVIAREGNTGHSTGPHLHFEVRIGGTPINPIPWLAKRGIFI